MIVVDETRVKVKVKDARIYVALYTRTLKIIYLEPFFRRDEHTTPSSDVTSTPRTPSRSIRWRGTGSGPGR